MNTMRLIEPHTVSLEFDTAGIRRIGDNLYKGLQLYVSDMHNFAKGTLSNLQGLERVSFSNNTALTDQVTGYKYDLLENLPVPVPNGLNVTMLEYLEALEFNQAIVDKLIPQCYKPAITYFSLLLSDPEVMSTISVSVESSKVNVFKDDITQALKLVGSCFIKNDRTEFVKYGNLYARNKDYAESQKRLEDLIGNLAKTPSKMMRDQVEIVCELLDKLSLRMKQDPEVYKLNGINAKAISELCFGLARVAEFYGSYYYMVTVLSAAVSDGNKKIRAAL